MGKIKVLLVGMSGNLGGIESFCRDLILNVGRRNVDFTLLLEEGIKLPYRAEILGCGTKILRFPSRKRHYRAYLDSLKRIYAENAFDVIHINLMTYSPFELVKYACRYSKGVVIVHSHNSGYRRGYYISRILHMYGNRQLKNNIFRKIACTRDAGQYMFGDADFDIIRNGVDFDKFEFSKLARTEVRHSLGFEDDDFVIGLVASFTPPKNHSFIMEILPMIKEKNKKIKFLFVGSGPEQRKVETAINSKGLNDFVKILQNRYDVNRIYSAMDAYIAPSSSEGMSIALCEAQVNGLPCIVSTNINDNSDISGRVTFLSLELKNEWVKTICDVACSDVTDRSNLVSKEYDVKAVALEMEQFYRRYLANDIPKETV